MKNWKNFAAQQLSKKQMNNVKGGRIWCNVILDGRANMGLAAANSVKEAEASLHATYDGMFDSVVIICDERF